MGEQVGATFEKQGAAWARREAPPLHEVHDRVWAAPIPVSGGGIRFVYAYLISDGDGGVTVIDPGWRSDRARRALGEALDQIGVGVGGVRQILVTHNHPDHLGLAADLARESGAQARLHGADVLALPPRRGDDRKIAAGLRPWLIEHGDDPHVGPVVSPAFADLEVPQGRLTDSEHIAVGDRLLQVVHTPGHTPGHACFVIEGTDVVLTGDHLLPRISPNVAGYPSSGPNPLGSFLISLGRLVDALPSPDTLALPSHEYAFGQVIERVAQVKRHHDKRLDEIADRLADGGARTAFELSQALTWSRPWADIGHDMRRAALAETVAHLVYMESLGGVRSYVSGEKRWWTT